MKRSPRPEPKLKYRKSSGRWNCRPTIWLTVLLALVATGHVGGQEDPLARARAAELRRVEVIARAVPATVSVFSTDGAGGGSGVVITHDGYALTNWHVVDPCGPVMYCSMPDGRIYDAVLVGIDPVGDVALIKLLERNDFPVATPADSDQVRVGESCFAVGNPFLLANNFQPSVSWGVVSGVHRYQYPSGTLLEYADCLQTDAAINPGNSGGALFNRRGELIGINGRGSFEKRGRINVGVGYAISINQIKLFLGPLQSGLLVDHASLGATVAADRSGRVLVEDILATSDAWRRGLRYGDEILSVGNREITTVNEFKNVIGIYPADWRVPVVFRRGDEEQRIWVRLPGVHSRENLIELVQSGPELPDAEPEPSPVPEGVPSPEADVDGDKPVSDRARKVASDHFTSRPGFANYRFNQMQTDRAWKTFREKANLAEFDGSLKLTGTGQTGVAVKMVLDEKSSGMQWGETAHVLVADRELASQLEPPRSHGWLAAMHLWRRFMAVGPAGSGDVYSAGALPDGQGVLRDVLICNTDGVQVRYFFDQQTGLMSGMEFWSSSDSDPCEIRLADYREAGQLQLPHQITVAGSDDYREILQVESWNRGDMP
jgi:S1-C subfamily serine protease